MSDWNKVLIAAARYRDSSARKCAPSPALAASGGIPRFPAGYGLRQNNDALDSGSHTTYDNRDGFNGQAFQQKTVGATGFPSQSINVMNVYDRNCGVDYFGFDP